MTEPGFQPPPQPVQVQPDESGSIELSAENIGLLDGDLTALPARR
ncbi:MAG: hypothetical protein ACT4NY_31035 [Pseudonocardiales bacterium]